MITDLLIGLWSGFDPLLSLVIQIRRTRYIAYTSKLQIITSKRKLIKLSKSDEVGSKGRIIPIFKNEPECDPSFALTQHACTHSPSLSLSLSKVWTLNAFFDSFPPILLSLSRINKSNFNPLRALKFSNFRVFFINLFFTGSEIYQEKVSLELL